MLSSVLVLKNLKFTDIEYLLVFDFKELKATFMIDGEIKVSAPFDSWEQLLAGFKFFMCKEDWCFYEV